MSKGDFWLVQSTVLGMCLAFEVLLAATIGIWYALLAGLAPLISGTIILLALRGKS